MSATSDEDVLTAQQMARNHAAIRHKYNNMASVTWLPSTLAAQLECVGPGRRYIVAIARIPDIRLHCVNVHLHPDGLDGWRTNVAKLQEHITNSAHRDTFIIGGDFNADIGRTPTRSVLASLLQECDVTRTRPPATQTPTWKHWVERDDGKILDAIIGARHNTTTTTTTTT